LKNFTIASGRLLPSLLRRGNSKSLALIAAVSIISCNLQSVGYDPAHDISDVAVFDDDGLTKQLRVVWDVFCDPITRSFCKRM
jgi:hypothetical protein